MIACWMKHLLPTSKIFFLTLRCQKGLVPPAANWPDHWIEIPTNYTKFSNILECIFDKYPKGHIAQQPLRVVSVPSPALKVFLHFSYLFHGI